MDTIEIPLTQNKVAIISACDAELINEYKWCAVEGRNTFYAKTNIKGDDGKQHTVKMHRLILDPPDGMQVDHISGDGLDNRRENLRVCNHAENQRNRLKYQSASSRYKGVSWNQRDRKWYSHIHIDRKRTHIGRFDDELEAARAYNQAAKKHYGEFARLNDIAA